MLLKETLNHGSGNEIVVRELFGEELESSFVVCLRSLMVWMKMFGKVEVQGDVDWGLCGF